MKFFKKEIRQEIEDRIKMVKDASMGYDVGSEEFLNSCKAINQLSEADGKLKDIDANVLVTGGISILMFGVYMIFADTHIVDTRGIQFVKSLFKRF